MKLRNAIKYECYLHIPELGIDSRDQYNLLTNPDHPPKVGDYFWVSDEKGNALVRREIIEVGGTKYYPAVVVTIPEIRGTEPKGCPVPQPTAWKTFRVGDNEEWQILWTADEPKVGSTFQFKDRFSESVCVKVDYDNNIIHFDWKDEIEKREQKKKG